ncbi:helix-turn-helix transcriptional regulator [Cryptosporangium phraense]|uniref:helix-turn-helix transcriptional regulator n=1 Tax=Cryptosporangium phraense TaxID=2593070 RepID=UPI00197AA0B3|nr:AAA family ATPase [Cryptosporangium phraense]
MTAPIGRERELDALDATLADGVGGCTVVTGPAGIGKSYLLDAVIRRARERGTTVATRRAFELDRAVPLISLASALRNCDPPSASFGWLPGESGNTFRTLERLGASLETSAAERPLVVAIDDAQWIDEFSALAIRQLVPALASSPVRWLLARRPQPEGTPGQQVVSWLRQEGADEVVLGGLPEDAVGALCAQVLDAEVDSTVLALASGFGGSPLQVTQLMRSLRVTDQLVIADGVATVVGTELPSSFVAMVRQVLDQLPDDPRTVVRSSAVFGRPFGLGEVARLLGRRPAELVPLIELAVSASLLTDAGGVLTFVHDLVRRAVHSTLGEAVAVVLHREAATIARADGRPPMEIAEHLLSGGRDGRREAVDELRAAAADVAAMAPSTAADLLVHALDVLGEHGPGRTALVAEAVGLLAAAGRLDQARDLGRAALRAGLDRPTEARLLLGLAEAFKHAGHNATAVGYADQGLRHTDGDALAARLYAIRAHAQVYTGDLAGADRSGEQADVIGRAVGEPGASVFGLCARSLVAQARGDLGGALRHAEVATALADEVGGEALQRHPRIWLAAALTELDRLDEAAREIERGRDESDRLGTGWSAPLWHYYGAAVLLARGELEDAVAEANAGVAVAERLGSHQLALPLLGTLVRVAVERGAVDAAVEYRGRMEALVAGGMSAAPEDVEYPRGLVLAAVGDVGGALEVLGPLVDGLPERPVLIAQDPGAAATLVRILVEGGDVERAEVVARTAAAVAARNAPRPEADRPGSANGAGVDPGVDRGGLAGLVGGAAHAAGLLNRDLSALRTAIEAFRRTPRRLALATALADAAAAADAGASADAGDLVGFESESESESGAEAWRAEALALASACGAHRLRRSLTSPANATAPTSGRAATHAGVSLEADPDHPSADDGSVSIGSALERLSPAERRVALLVADGLTNHQVAAHLHLSRHTVDSHLRKIFAKWTIQSRVALATVVARDLPTREPDASSTPQR